MAQDWTVTKAFLSTVSKTDKTPQVIPTKGGDMHKYMVQVEGQPVDGWLQILKKPVEGRSDLVKPGDTIYGDIVENNWGKPQFNRAQKPFDGQPQAQPAQQSQPSGEVEAKLDYIISLLENFLDSQKGTTVQADVSPEDIDDGPVDLSSLDY